MAKQRVDIEIGSDGELLDTSTALVGVSMTEYDRPRAWDQYVAGFLAGNTNYGEASTIDAALRFADKLLIERDKRFPIE